MSKRYLSCKSRLLMPLALDVVSDRLGHASASFTLSTYGHSQPGRQATAALVKYAVPRLPHEASSTELAERSAAL